MTMHTPDHRRSFWYKNVGIPNVVPSLVIGCLTGENNAEESFVSDFLCGGTKVRMGRRFLAT